MKRGLIRGHAPLMREIHVDVGRLIAETPKIKCDGIRPSAAGHAWDLR
jgi:hypothetical protein